jgi:heavy metal sensor kinase
MRCGRLIERCWGACENLSRTLRFRLTFWNTGVILLIVLATLVGLRESLRYTLINEFDAVLSEDINEVASILDRYYPDWPRIREELDRKAKSHTAREWFARIYDKELRTSYVRTEPPQDQVPLDANRTTAMNSEGFRVLHRLVPKAGRPDYIVRVGASLASVNQDVTQLTEKIVLIGTVLLIVAPLTGYWLAGRATRPLANILKTTARLRPGHLNERLPIYDTGDELDKLSSTINDLLDRLAEHVQRQREFISNAAHELRSPLAALRTSFEVALDHDRSAEDYRELLSDLIEECEGMSKLVNQLLLLAEGDAGLAHSGRRVRLDHIVQRSIDMFQGIAEQKDVRLDASRIVPATVIGNDFHLRQVLHNLIDNALKFTLAGGEVDVAISVDVDRDTGRKQALVRVRDTGTGIDPVDLPHIGERFYRADKSRQRLQPISGTGLGLSICKAIVTSYGGQLVIESQVGQGTVVTVALPLVAELAVSVS